MSLKIKVLSDQLANQIAAGEVVDRPASVVKELVENAVDAQATQIEIDIRGAGKSYIMVKDNGSGMEKEDLFTAFERHATSKIRNEEDLAQIQTLGFRGEALPSIASVSKVKMESRSETSPTLGGSLRIEGGKVVSFAEMPLPKGTRAEISHLFYNVPARRKFLKSDATEQTHLTNTVIQQILANEGVGFHYEINGKVFVKVLPEADFAERIKLLFGNSIFDKLVKVEFKYGDTLVKGYILHPNFSPTHANYQFSFLNGRYIRDKVIHHAIASALKNVISSEKKPAYFLKIEVPFSSVDVNVHPSKYEVRFSASQQVHFVLEQAIRASLESAITQSPLPPRVEAEENPFQGFQRRESSFIPSADPNDILAKGHIRNWQALEKGVENQALKRGFEPSYQGSWARGQGARNMNLDSWAGNEATPKRELPRFEGGFSNVSPSLSFSSLTYIGQWQKSFLLFDSPEGIVIVDQHTAHERVMKERLVSQYEKGSIEVSNLLIPVKVELPLNIADSVEKHAKDLARLGFEVTRSGNNIFHVRSVPALLAEEEPEKLFDDLITSLSEKKETRFVDMIDPLIDRIACHRAVRAFKELNRDDVALLCRELDELKVKISCPHGRPIALLIRSNDIMKGFFRA